MVGKLLSTIFFVYNIAMITFNHPASSGNMTDGLRFLL